jgi:hypothetical protein
MQESIQPFFKRLLRTEKGVITYSKTKSVICVRFNMRALLRYSNAEGYSNWHFPAAPREEIPP